MNRRKFCQNSALAVGGSMIGGWTTGSSAENGMISDSNGKIVTVAGPISSDEMGFVLTHEHVLVDFVGADQIHPDRYDVDEVYEVILPYLKQAWDLGCRTFVECTPAYLGRDPRLLKRLSEATGIHILSNTGYYGAGNDKYVPSHAYDETPDQLANRWVKEWEEGIEGTGIHPGFIKIGVDRGSLSEIDRKLVIAGARTHLRTGLTLMAHTGPSTPAMEELDALAEEGVDGSAWIWTHAQNERDNAQHVKAARAEAWVAFDGVNPRRLNLIVRHMKAMKEAGVLDRTLLSHDAGWYEPGEPNGGQFRAYDLIFREFLPALKKEGFSDAEIDLVTLENPKKAFAIAVRSR